MNHQLAFCFNKNKCIDCKTCTSSCNEYLGIDKELTQHNVVSVNNYDPELRISRLLTTCLHCRNPVCVYACPQGNYRKRYDGIVIRNSNRCQFCKKCIEACPFNAIKFCFNTNKVYKCDFCVDRIDQGLNPICVDSCLTGALSFVKTDINEHVLNNVTNLNLSIPMMVYSNPSIIIQEN